MNPQKDKENQRQRAPSQRSLATRTRIFNAAETLFSERGFEGASIRDIAAAAGVQGALVNHHGGSKEALFATIVSRRAEELARLRLDALDVLLRQGTPSLRDILACFITPLLDKVTGGDPGWLAYGRLIALVSADDRWRELTEACFDPTVARFIGEIRNLRPDADPARIGACFVFMVSAMLSVCTSRWRIGALAGGTLEQNLVESLLDFCEAGFETATRP
jgi:Transcriptional regulator